MPHTFRFEPPEPRPGSITRPRLLRALLGRWEHQVTSVIGGPGLGKTTLLAQSLAENRLAPRGHDVWIGLEAADAEAGSLARDLLLALEPDPAASAGGDRPSPRVVADALWRRAPGEVCLVLDNVHLIRLGSPGAAWLSELVEALPANGHMLLSSRSALPVPVVRLATRGALLRIGEDDLRFSEEEMTGFALRHDINRALLTSTGGWPAMAELTATVETDLAGEYLWEEVVRPLGPERRHVLAAVVDLGGADDALASAALGRRVDLAEELAGVPLVAVGAGGWRAPHALWRSARALGLRDERTEIRRRAVAHMTRLRRYDEAVTLAHEADLPDLLPAVLRAACVAGARPTVAQLDRWLALSPREVRASPAGRLAEALRATLVAPTQSIQPLRDAAKLLRDDGDLDGEMVAIANLGRVGWWHADMDALRELIPRVNELSAGEHPFGRAMMTVGRAIFADLEGDDAGVLANLDAVEPGALDPAWDAVARWMGANVVAGTGDAEAAFAALEGIGPTTDPNFILTIAGLRLTVQWMLGHVDQVVKEAETYVGRVRASGLHHNFAIVLPVVSRLLSHVGDVNGARAHLDELAGLWAAELDGATVGAALAWASLHVAEGDDERAAAVVAAAVAEHGLDGADRRAWRLGLALPYVLLPDSRSYWDGSELRSFHDVSRRLATAVVAVRSGADDKALRDLALPEPGIVRAALHHRFAAELAVGLEAAGHAGSGQLLEAIGPVGRAAVRELAASGGTKRTRPAKALLAAVPAPPPTVTQLGVLGPLTLRRDGEQIIDPALRRERLRALLAFLVSRRETTRAAIMAALWPDLDERAAGNNLRVTLTYLLRLLEPWRTAGESSFHVRTGGQRVELVTGQWLRVDLDEFDEEIAAAARAEADGTPSLALDHNLAAVALYRAELHADVAEAEWNVLDRDRYRTRFVAAATRAGQLLAARGDTDEADAVAHRAIAVDPWAEDAYAVLVGTALARGDRSGARQALDRCMAALADLGVDASDETQRLRRRVRTSGA